MQAEFAGWQMLCEESLLDASCLFTSACSATSSFANGNKVQSAFQLDHQRSLKLLLSSWQQQQVGSLVDPILEQELACLGPALQ